MADYGLEIINGNSHLIIDSTYENHAELERGVGTFLIHNPPGSTASRQASRATIYFSRAYTHRPTIGVQNQYDSSGAALVSLIMSGGLYTGFRLQAEINKQNTTVHWVAFGPSSMTPASNDTYGLIVNNSSGKEVFHSGKRYLIIKDIVQVPYNIDTNDTPSFTHNYVAQPIYLLSPIQGRAGYEKFVGVKGVSTTSGRFTMCGWDMSIYRTVVLPYYAPTTQTVFVCSYMN